MTKSKEKQDQQDNIVKLPIPIMPTFRREDVGVLLIRYNHV